MDDIVNITRRVTWQGGWIGLLEGESQGKALDRELDDLNEFGFRVVFIIPDRLNPFLSVLWILIGILTLGFFWKQPNLLIVAEGPVKPPASWGIGEQGSVAGEPPRVGTDRSRLDRVVEALSTHRDEPSQGGAEPSPLIFPPPEWHEDNDEDEITDEP